MRPSFPPKVRPDGLGRLNSARDLAHFLLELDRGTREISQSYVSAAPDRSPSSRLNDTRRVTRSGTRWTPKTFLDVLRNATYTGKLPLNGDLYQANHEPITSSRSSGRAQKLLEVRAESLSSCTANASNYP